MFEGRVMNTRSTVVLVIDEDPILVRSLRRLLSAAGHQVRVFSSTSDLYRISIEPDCSRCAIIDLEIGGGNGLTIQSALERRFPDIPVIFISADGDVPSTVRAMKAGAVDFLTKPLEEHAVLESVRRALEKDRSSQHERNELTEIARRFNSLTPREHEVLELVVSGRLNKQIGGELGTSEKTIKVHRGRIMRKMGVQSLAELVQVIVKLRSASSAIGASKPPRMGVPLR